MSGMSPTVEPFFEGWLMTRTRFVHTWKLRHVRLFCSTDSKNAIEISQAESGCNTETLALDCITSISTVEASVFDRPHCFSIAYCEKHRWFKHKQVLGFQARDDAQRSAWVSKLQQASQSVKPDGEEQDTRDLGGSEWVNAPKSSIAAGIKQILPHLRSMQSAVVATPKLNTDSVTWDTLSNISTTASGTFTLLEETAIQFEDVGVDSKKGSGEPGMKEQDPQGCVVTPCEKPLPFGDRLPLSDAGDLSSEDGSVFDNLFEERSSDEVKEDIATLEWVFQQVPVKNEQRPMAKTASQTGPSTQDEFQRWIQAINKVVKSNRRSNFLHDFTHHMSNTFSSKKLSSTTVPSRSGSESVANVNSYVPLKSGMARKLRSWQAIYQRSPLFGAE